LKGVSLKVNFQTAYWCSIAGVACDMQGYKYEKSALRQHCALAAQGVHAPCGLPHMCIRTCVRFLWTFVPETAWTQVCKMSAYSGMRGFEDL